MNFFKRIFLILCLIFVLSTSVQTTQAAGIFDFNDPPGCESKDGIFPNLLICGRNPASSDTCKAYSKPCNLGDLMETGYRFLLFMIILALLIIPLFVMYYGAMIIINQKMDGNVGAIKKAKERLWEVILYFILMLSAWLIVRTVVDVFQVDDRVNTFLIDESGNRIKAKPINERGF